MAKVNVMIKDVAMERCNCWKGGRIFKKNGYIEIRQLNKTYISEHRVVAITILGKPLPNKAVVHHADGDKTNNSPSNLVICENQTYHSLLHKRKLALQACGNANWLRCKYCKQYDDPFNIVVSKHGDSYHALCAAKYRRILYRKKRGLPGEGVTKSRVPVVINNLKFRTIAAASRYFNIHRDTFRSRLKRGLNIKQALGLNQC